MNELSGLAAYTAEFHIDDVPAEVIKAAIGCVIDILASSLGACDDPLIIQIMKAYGSLESGSANARVWGHTETFSPLRAAYMNAMTGHVLEMDDVHTRSKTHIGTVVIPSAWAFAEHFNSSGKQFLEAVICGYEVMARIGMGFGVSSHRDKGWHATSTAGTFGAAAASAKLMGLTAEQVLYAFGLAGTQSFGLWAFLEDGATNKTLHPAHAAMTGMESALLAKAGMTGARHILDARDGGLYRATSDASDISLVNAGLGTVFEILHLDKKPYPCCRSTHCAIDAAKNLREKYGLVPEAIDKVHVKTYRAGFNQCGRTETSLNPGTPAEARFSTPFTAACVFLDGNVELRHFLPENIRRPEIRKLLSRISVAEDNEFSALYPAHWGCEMTATTLSGEQFSARISDASGSPESPLSDEQVREKFLSLSAPVLGKNSGPALQQLLSLEDAHSLADIRLRFLRDRKS